MGIPSTTVGTFNFTVMVTDGGRGTGSRSYSISVACSMPGDINNDGVVNGLDIQHFIDCATSGITAGGNCGCADMDANGVVNELDIPGLITALGL